MAGQRCRTALDRDGSGGFALVEVMLALILIAVLAALAMPGLARAPGSAALRVTAFQISALLREDRNAAQNAGRSVTSSVRSDRVVSGASHAAVFVPIGAAVRVVDAPSPDIRFFTDGRSSGGTILVETAAARYAVAVRRDTGAILVTAH